MTHYNALGKESSSACIEIIHLLAFEASIKITRETPEVRSDKRIPREDRQRKE